MKIVFDARMISMSGIGRYIRSILPYILWKYEVILLGSKKALSEYQAEVIEMNSKIYSPIEQYEFIKKIPPADIFWSPQFNAPVFKIPAKKRIVTIHDVFQITQMSKLNPLAKLYAKFLFKNAVKNSNLLIAISQFTRDEIIGRLNLDIKQIGKIKIIYRSPEVKFMKKEYSFQEKMRFMSG